MDIVVEKGAAPVLAVEVKSSGTYRSRYFNGLSKIAVGELGLSPASCVVVYGGEKEVHALRGTAVSFRHIASLPHLG